VQALVRSSLSALRPQGPLPQLLPVRALALQLVRESPPPVLARAPLFLLLQPAPWPEPRAMQPPAR
jgi:hypothetical protein